MAAASLIGVGFALAGVAVALAWLPARAGSTPTVALDGSADAGPTGDASPTTVPARAA